MARSVLTNPESMAAHSGKNVGTRGFDWSAAVEVALPLVADVERDIDNPGEGRAATKCPRRDGV
ncbi:hypothetical protein [Antrihabitans spumae]|uniref:Uncharacterized protein n=1 Tax=Antrihabitans spumae TaxID=3373370 RepID=A0ABW7K757_9NOCA